MKPSDLEKFCMSFKGATQDVKWGNDLCFLVGNKMFCVTSLHSGEGGTSFKATDEDFAELIERDGIIPAPYMARNHWVFVEHSKALRPQEWKNYIQKSYEMIFDKLPKKSREQITSKK